MVNLGRPKVLYTCRGLYDPIVLVIYSCAELKGDVYIQYYVQLRLALIDKVISKIKTVFHTKTFFSRNIPMATICYSGLILMKFNMHIMYIE